MIVTQLLLKADLLKRDELKNITYHKKESQLLSEFETAVLEIMQLCDFPKATLV